MNLFRTNAMPVPKSSNSSSSSSSSSSSNSSGLFSIGMFSSSSNSKILDNSNGYTNFDSSNIKQQYNTNRSLTTATITSTDASGMTASIKEKVLVQSAVIYGDGRIYSNESSIDLATSAQKEVIESDIDSFLIGLHHKFDSNVSTYVADQGSFQDFDNRNSSNYNSNSYSSNYRSSNGYYNQGFGSSNPAGGTRASNEMQAPSSTATRAPLNPSSGIIGSTSPNFVETRANQGDFGGERRAPGIDNSIIDVNNFPVSVTGRPKKYDLVDKINVVDRAANKTLLSDTGGSRVNHSSQERKYQFDDYEKSILIDPNRHLAQGRKEEEAVDIRASLSSSKSSEGASAEDALVPFEVAAMSSKIKNMHKVGGERVKEMDHFVKSVEVPVLRYQMSDGSGNIRATELGRMVQQKTKSFNLANSITVQPDGRAATPGVSVESIYIDKDGKVPAYIMKYSKLFMDLIETVCRILTFDFSNIRFFYMRTVRCNEFICFRDDSSIIWVNVLVFQQGKNCDLRNNEFSSPVQISHSKMKELLVYWITRISSSFASSADPNVPRGLYNNSVWDRLQSELAKPSTSISTKVLPPPPHPSTSMYASSSSSSPSSSPNNSLVSQEVNNPDLLIHREAIENLTDIFPHISPNELLSRLKQNNCDLSRTIDSILQSS